MLQGVHASRDSVNPQAAQIESTLLSVLSSLREKSNFDGIVPTGNSSSQTLAHLYTLYTFVLLLIVLVEWRIDLTIPDISGLFTQHHYGYLGERQESIRVPLRLGALLSIDIKLGRLPRDLFPQGPNLAGWLDGEIGIGAGSPPVKHPVGHENSLGALFTALEAGENRVNVSGHGGSDSGGIGSLTLEPGPSISTVSIFDLINRFLIPKQFLEKRGPRLGTEAEYAANEHLRNGVSSGDMTALRGLKGPTAAQAQDATQFRVEEGDRKSVV